MIVLALAAFAPACTGDSGGTGVVDPDTGTPAEETSTPIDSTLPDTNENDTATPEDTTSPDVESETATETGGDAEPGDSTPTDTAMDDTATPADTATPTDTATPVDTGVGDTLVLPDAPTPDVGDALACTARVCTNNAQCKPGCGNCVSGFCTNP